MSIYLLFGYIVDIITYYNFVLTILRKRDTHLHGSHCSKGGLASPPLTPTKKTLIKIAFLADTHQENYVLQWIGIYLVDSPIYASRNWGLPSSIHLIVTSAPEKSRK